MKRFGLRAKFILLLSVLLLVLFSSVAFILVRQSSSSLRTNLNEQAKSFATLATKPIGDSFLIFKDSGRLRIQQQVDKFGDLNRDISEVAIVDSSGVSQYDSADNAHTKISVDDASSLDTHYSYNHQGEITQVTQPYIEDFGAHRYSIVYTVSNKRVAEAIFQEEVLIIALTLIALLVSVALSYVLINNLFLHPVREVSSSALAISDGNLQKEVEVRRDDEIGDLASSVNKMANSLKADIVKLREVDQMKSEFMMITSHNLRTPLSLIDGYLEMAKTLKVTPQVKKIFDTIKANSVRLGTFAEGVLTISTFESGQMVLHKESEPMKPIIDRIVQDFTLLAPQKKLKFSASVNIPDVQVDLSKSHFRSAMWNLLDNAYKFTGEGGQVTLNAAVKDGNLAIAVGDTGVGIAVAEIPKLFTKFHRATSTLKYDYDGVGIGLYLTKLIVEQHGGRIDVSSVEGKGSTFTAIWPLHIERPKPQGASVPAASQAATQPTATAPVTQPKPNMATVQSTTPDKR